MEPESTARDCAFDFAEALEFDPTLRQLLDGETISRIRLPYGEGKPGSSPATRTCAW